MKDFKKLTGAKTLSKTEQKAIKGGAVRCGVNNWCPMGFICLEESGWCIHDFQL